MRVRFCHFSSYPVTVSTNNISFCHLEICEDVQEECSKYGVVEELKIPRPSAGSRQAAGVGKIYVKFDTPEAATKALQALAGRKFQDRTVVTTYFSEASYPNSNPRPSCFIFWR